MNNQRKERWWETFESGFMPWWQEILVCIGFVLFLFGVVVPVTALISWLLFGSRS